MYYIVACGDLTQLKAYHPGPGLDVAATIMGPHYPLDESYTVYVWDNWNEDTPDDLEVVKPTVDPTDHGRWLKVDSSGPPPINADWNATSGPAEIYNKPSFATVALSGAYTDLTGRPSLHTVATSGVYNDLSGKPSLATVATSGAYTDLSGKPSLATVATSGSYNDLSNKPTIPSIQSTRVQTNSSGSYTWTFPAAFGSGVIPKISVSVEDNTSATWNHQITAISNTSVTIQLSKTTAVSLLGVTVLGVAANPQAYIHLIAL